jgi:hypothetical protein
MSAFYRFRLVSAQTHDQTEPSGFSFNPAFTGLRKKLPPNIHLLSLEQWSIDSILLRLEHFFEINEDSQYSRSKTINLKDLFFDFQVIDVQETSLNVVESKMAAENERVQYEAQFNPYANFANMFDDPEGKFHFN